MGKAKKKDEKGNKGKRETAFETRETTERRTKREELEVGGGSEARRQREEGQRVGNKNWE